MELAHHVVVVIVVVFVVVVVVVAFLVVVVFVVVVVGFGSFAFTMYIKKSCLSKFLLYYIYF